MKDIEELKKILQEHKDELENEYGVTEIGVFGSYSKKQETKTSDLDILIDFQKAVDLLTFVHLKNYLSDILKINVDLVMKKALKPKIGERILKEVVYI
ncbi:MAG: nucleotidyltransferase family protein [Nitrospirota bacterium]